MGTIRRWSGIALTLCLTIPGGASTAGPDAFRCQVVAFSPDVAQDRNGMCVTLGYDAGTVNPDGNATSYVTTDAGRTWRRARSDGLRPVLGARLQQLVFSPTYATDGSVYLLVQGRGLLVTTDSGDTWLPATAVTASSTAYRHLTPVGAVDVAGLTARPVLAFANEVPALVAPPLHVPVAGAPGFELQFLSQGGRTVVASLDTEPSGGAVSARTRLYACDAALTCATRLAGFPAGHDWLDGWPAPDFASSGRLYAVTADATGGTHAWLSTDGGRTVAPWTALDRYLRPLTNAASTVVALASRRGSRTLYARISHRPFPRQGPVLPSPPAPPGEQVLRSDDAGRTWRRVASGLAYGQQGRRGTLPWNDAGMGPPYALGFELLPDGRLVTVAAKHPTYFGVYESADGGRTWTPARFFS